MSFRDDLKKYRESQGIQTETAEQPTTTSSAGTTSGNTGSGGSGLSFRDALKKYREENATSSVDSWAETSLNLISDVRNKTGSWYDDNAYKSMYERFTSMLSQADNWRKQYGGNAEAVSYIDSVVAALSEAKNYSYNSRKYYSQWDSQEAYNEYLAYQKDYEEKKNFDVTAAQKEIEELESRKAQLVSESRKPAKPYAAGSKYAESAPYAAGQQASSVDVGSKEIRELDALISQKKQYLNQAKHIQKGVTLSSVAESADFKEYSGYVSTYDDSGWARLLGKEYDDAYEYINNREGFRDAYKSKHRAYSSDNPWSDGESSFEEKGYDYLNQNEIAIYNYYYAKEGKEKAQEYLDNIQETLNQRKAGVLFKDMEDNTALELVFGVEAGLDQFKSGIQNLFNTEDDYIAQSAYQMASAMVREDLADDGFKLPDWLGGASIAQVGYDAITTTANMAPSIMTSMAISMVNPVAGQAIGTGLMGASASGNAYQEMLNMGYDKSQARAYSALVGASEAGLQYLLGGIGNLGGKLSGSVLTKMMNGVDNAFLRTAIKLAGNMASEGLEEGLQEILTPWFQNLIMHTDENVNWSEVAYSTLLGALTAGIMEGGSTISGEVNTYKTGKQLKEADISAKRLAELGKTFSSDTVAYQLAGRVDENTGAYTMGRLFNEIGATMTEQNVNDITQALVEKGMSEDVARANAKAMAVVADGGNLTDLQVAIIESNEVLAEAVRTTIIDSNATWFQRSKGYNDALMALAKEKTAPKASRTEQSAPGRENADAADTVDAQNESGSEADAGPVKVKSISSIQNGQVAVRLEDGSEVNLKEADLDPNDGVLIETIAGIEGISTEDANFLLNTLRTSPSVTAQMGALGAKEAYKYGFYGFSQDHIAKHGVFANTLNETQRKAIYETGRNARAAKVAGKQEAVSKKETTTQKVSGKVHFEGDISRLTDRQSVSLTAMEKVAEILGVQIYLFESKVNEKGQRIGANGWYDPTNSSIHIDLFAGVNGQQTMMFTLAHELTHHIRKWSPEKFKILADFLMEEYGKKGVNVDGLVRAQIDKAWRTRKKKLSYDAAFEEVVADSMEIMLADGNVLNRLAKLKAKDESLWHEIKRFVNEFAEKIRSAYKKLTPDSDEGKYVADMGKAVYRLQELFAEALVDASENYQSMMTMEENTDAVAVEEVTQYSYRSLAEAAGFEAVENEDGTRSFLRNGVKVSKVTVDDIEHSPIGAFINYSLAKNDISEKEAKRQKKMFAEICTMACKTNDFAMTMQFVGSAVFTGMKANADKQYGTTYDFPSICTKTQAVIDAMSKRMVSLGRGLKSDELVKLYQDVFTSGNPVPCPECYVFSRWIGIGGLLDNIKKYQDFYGDMKVEDVAKAYTTMRDELAAFAEEQGISFSKAKGALTSKLTKEYNKLTEKIEKAENQGEKVKPADRKRLEELEPMMNTVKGMTWLENVYFADSSLKKVNPRFRVPNEVLFDLNNGEAFATKYKEAWLFRTTQGAGYGKAITPYAEARLGEGILVTNNTKNTIRTKAQGSLDNFFLRQKGTLDKKAREALDKARTKQKAQAFIGGQRFQSTSDARYENASDYLLAALEMQAMHGMVQVYTKVDGAVPALATWNYSINQSLMPLGGGLDENGNVRDTSVGGMNPKIAFRNRENHETAGTITIGVNDNHIRAMFKQWVRDFIIPYHASGGKADVVAAFRSIQEGQEKRGQMVRSTDYSRTQSDKILSDEVLRWQGKTEAEIQRIHEVREARIAILTGGKPNMDVVRSNRFLSALYDKLNGGEWDKVKLSKSKVESQIFPNEFWDQRVSYEDSGKVTRDYLEYCEDLGFLHRFSGMVPSNGKLVSVKGYDQNGNRVELTDLAYKYDENGQKTDQIEDYFWKVLTDRRMYDNQGKYLPQKVVTLNDTTEDTVTSFAKGNYGRQYDKALSMKTAEEIAGKMYSERDLEVAVQGIQNDVHTDDANAFAEQVTDVVNTVLFSDRDQVHREETYSAIGKELLSYEEGNKKPDLTLVETVNERTGKTETTIKHFGQKPKGYVPKKIAYCYKLFEQHPDGTLHALFAGAKGETPVGVWQYAQGFPYTDAGVKGMNLRERYGWHLSAGLPSAPHLMSTKDFNRGYPSENQYGHPKGSKRVWVRMAYDASTDFNAVADSTKEGDIFGLIPFGGYYAFKENNQSEWVISSAVKIDKILKEEERQQILRDAGYDEYEAWRRKHRATEEEKAESKRKSAENKKAKDKAIKAGLNYLSESSRAMRESIQSRIIDNPEIKYSDRDYAYNTLVSKPDMVVTEVGGNVPTNRADIIAMAKKNATSVGRFDPKTGSIRVHVTDIGKDVVIGTTGLKHGLEGRRTENAIVTLKAGEILQNSIRINELTPKKDNADGSYVLIGAARGSGGELHIVRSVINTFKHELMSMDVLYAINAKKGNRLRSMRPGFQGPVTDSTISIAELLDHVNQYFPDILPEEVLKHYGYDARPEGVLGEDALYSDRDNAPTFYSHMARVVDGVKQEKLGAASVVSMLRGKGVKAEEIKWSGIEEWLAGKKSVTKAELQEFIAGSMLQIEEETLTNEEIPYTENQQKRIAEHTAKRDEIAQELSDAWKEITGDAIPIANFGAGLESSVESKIRDVNLEYKKAAFEGRLLEKLRKDLKEVIANNDDFGFDSWKEALISIHRNRRSFIDHYEMSTADKAVIVKYCNALNAYNELPNKINDLDTGRLRRIAHEADLYNRKIGDVRSEHYAENAKHMTRWGQYKLKGGENYREVLFKIPGSSYYNDAMAMHWEERDGVLAHARIQDLNTFLGRMLFIEELQSDWHNEGHKEGYNSDREEALKKIADLRAQWDSLYNDMIEAGATEARAISKRMDAIDTERANLAKKVRYGNFVPDAPFKDTYHEYVLKRLIRMAAEEGYDSIGWTPAEIQVKRWSEEFAEGYRIEYDQDIPKFLNKYGKKWGTRVGKTVLDNGTEVWAMAITDEMTESVLTEGQALYSDRDTESVSNRSLLANAFEGVAQDDFERNKIREYRDKIDLINEEERKLAELNQKIKDLSFSKGPKDTKAIKDLQFEAKQAANRINTYDSQLLRLEASKPLQAVLAREKQKAYKRAEKKGKEALEAYRERAAKTQRELLDRYQESRKKATESREKTAMRHKIQSVVGELNDLLLNESKKRHVPDSLKKAVADALALVNMDTVGAEERAAKYAALIARETDPDKIDAYTVTMENILRQGEKMGQRLKELRDAYEEIQDSDDPDIANAYDPVIAGCLKELSQSIGNTSLRNMTIEQLSDVYDMYRMVLTRVREANKTLMENIKENISNLASRVIGEVRISGGEHKYRAAALDPVRKFLWNNLKPVYAMEHIGSGTLTKVFDNVRSGEDTWAKDVTEAREFYLDKARKFGYDSWDFKKKYRFQSDSELEFELTLEQILSLYAYSKREQAADHLRLGGFVFDSNIETYKEKDGKTGKSILKYRVNTADAHQITPEILMNITGKLSDNQKAFVDEMQGYLSTTMGAKGNEVTMKMYGVKLFKEKFYFPLKSAKQFMFEQNEVSGEVRIKNSGFTNKVVAKANNPVILSNFMDVWSGHVNDMSMYHAFVLPLEDFNRVFNYNSPKKEGQPPVSVKGTIQNAYSPAAVNYVKGLITDLNGGARGDSTTGIINKMMGLFKKGSVFASLSVVVQQPSAIARAAALVDTKYFIGAKVDSKRHKALWEEVKQYAPVAIIKEMGYFDTNMGKSTQDFIVGKEYSGIKEKMKALVTDSDYRDEVLSKAPALADEMAWCSIWEAVKRETKAQYPGLDAKSEPFLMLAGSRFTEVITKTQVYDSVLARSANMRSKDTGMKMATAFMAEPTTSINMIADALLQGKRGKKRYARAAIGAVIASQIFNAILVSFVYAGRDDDEDKTYWEKYIGTLSGEIIDSLNPAGYIPFIKDIQSIVQGYDVERSDMAVISDLWKACENLSKDNVSVYRKVEGFAGSIAQIFGLPVKNIMRDVRGIWQTVESFMNGQQTTKAGIGYAVESELPKWMGGGDTTDQNQLYEAMLSGDKDQIARVKGRYKDQSAINSAIRKGLRENDPRIKQAAQAKFNGNLSEYTRLAKEIIGEKHFSQDDVVAAINAEINLLDTDKETASTQKASGLYKAADFATAIVQGNSAMANAIKTDIIQTAQKNGKTESEALKSFSNTASGDMKELFLEGKLSESAAMDALVTYCEVDQEDAEERVGSWAFELEWGFAYSDRVDAYKDGLVTESELRAIMAEFGGLNDLEIDNNMTAYNWMKSNPEYDVTVSDALAYTKTIENIGISVEQSGIAPDTFVEYRGLRSKCNGEDANGDGRADTNTVKNEVLLVIDALPISNYQKDVLYYLNGWAASKLWQAPWH